MAWTTLLNAVFAIDKPAIGAHMISMRDNLAAALAGMSGAPRVAAIALSDDAHKGTRTLAGTSLTAAITGLASARRIGGALAMVGLNNGIGQTFRCQYSTDGGSTWGGTIDLFPWTGMPSSGASMNGEWSHDLETGDFSLIGVSTASAAGFVDPVALSFSGTSTVPAGVNAVRYAGSVAGHNGYMTARVLSGRD